MKKSHLDWESEKKSISEDFRGGILPWEQSIEKESLKGKRVLIADDLEGNQVLGALFLKIAGAEVEVASNGADAVKKALNGNHDAIWMDIHMPILNGLAATEHLRQQGYRKPIIVISSDCRSGVKEKAFEIGANSFLERPLNLADVVKTFIQYCCQTSATQH